LAAIVTSSADAIISNDMNGIILDWNAQAKLLFGYRSEEAIGKPITLIIPPELFAEEDCLLKRMQNGEKVEHIETVKLSKDGCPLYGHHSGILS
jgi:PAS domain S-box-containing protein